MEVGVFGDVVLGKMWILEEGIWSGELLEMSE